MIAKVLYCAKFGTVCAALIAGYTICGRERKFVPFMGQVYKSVFGEANKITYVIENTGLTETPIKKSVTEMVTKYVF
jgi:hypothetical protein